MLQQLTYDITDLRESFADAKRRVDLNDLNDEMAGRDNYKIARFLSADQREERKEQRSGHVRRAEGMSRLQLLLFTNAAYARLYNETLRDLRDAEDATDRAIAKAEAALAEAQQKLEQTLNRAATLPNGTCVFRDAGGNVLTERGERVSDADAARIEWRGDEPAYEQFLEDSESVRDRLTRLEVLQGYRVDTVGGIRDRMMDEENPPSKQEVEQFKRDIREKMPPEVQAEVMSQTPVAASVNPVTAFDIPLL